MPPLTAEQEARAAAWAKVFEDGPATTVTFEDMIVFIRAMPGSLERAGAWDLYGYIQAKRAQLRRAARREGKGSRHA